MEVHDHTHNERKKWTHYLVDVLNEREGRKTEEAAINLLHTLKKKYHLK